jgi:hypothetical protein
MVALAAACGSSEIATAKIADPRGSKGDAAIGSGGARMGSGGGAGFGGDGSATGGASADSGIAGAGGSAVVDAGPPPTEIPSTQTVTFTVTNKSRAERYVATQGNNCTTVEFNRLVDGGQSLVALALGYQCPCECPAPGSARPTAFRRVGAGETFEVTWDARGLTTWRDSVTCNDWAPLPPRSGSFIRGVLQPVGPGRFRVVLGVEATLPPGCTGSGPDYRCDVNYDTNDLSELAPRCTTSSMAIAEFTLPASGDIAVPVEIN